MQLPVIAIGVQRFTCSPVCKHLVAEHSDLMGYSLQQRLYDDAYDVGFALHNPMTRAETRWAFARESRDAEHELIAMIFVPCTESVRKHPELQGWEVHVLND